MLGFFLWTFTLVTPMAWDRAPEGKAFHGNDGKAGFHQDDWNRIAHPICWNGFVEREQPCSTTHPLALYAISFMDWKKIQGFQDGTESLVPHEGGELSKHRDCFWQEKCKKKYSSLLGLCLILEEMKLLTPWRGKSPQNMKIYGVCCSLIKYWTSHQSGNFYGGEIFVSLPLLVLGWDQGITC